MKIIAIVFVTLLGFVNVTVAQQESSEAPLEDVWPELADARRGDVAFANLTVTPERSKPVDFSTPFSNKARELLVTGPGAPAIESVEDLSGKEIVCLARRVTTRASSS